MPDQGSKLVKSLVLQIGGDCIKQPQGRRRSEFLTRSPTSDDAGGRHSSFEIWDQRFIRHTNHNFIRSISACDWRKLPDHLIGLICRTLDHRDVFGHDRQFNPLPGGRDQTAMRIEAVFPFARSVNQRIDPVGNLVQHSTQSDIQVDRTNQNDLSVGATLTKLDRFEPCGLYVPQFERIQAIQIRLLNLSQSLPALRFRGTCQR